MRYKPEHREESRSRILGAVGRGFRKSGYGGIGVDGLAREAGMTSGAFYGHFPSKAEAFREAVVDGLRGLRATIERFQADHGPAWIETFVDFYLGTMRTCDLADGCALQTLTPEVGRAERSARQAYEAALLPVIEAVAGGLPQEGIAERRARAWALLAILSGAVTTARALDDTAIAANAAKAVRSAALLVATSQDARLAIRPRAPSPGTAG